MIITPLSGLASNSRYAATQANFPALKHFFPCDEATAATTLTDSVGGVVIPVAGGVTQLGSAIQCADLTNVTITGSWSTPAGTAVMVVVCDADVTSAALFEVSLGGNPGVNNFIGVGGGGSVSGFGQGATMELAVTSGQTSEGIVGLRCTPGTGVDIWNGSTTTTTKGTGGATGTPSSWAALTGEYRLASFTGTGGGNGLYGFALFDFATAPSDNDMARALSWMNSQWLQGNKLIYPGWRGIS